LGLISAYIFVLGEKKVDGHRRNEWPNVEKEWERAKKSQRGWMKWWSSRSKFFSFFFL
jgi:hypothetical protein